MTPDRVKAIRAGLGLTQAGMAGAMGSDIRTIQRWESGERSPRGSAVKLLEAMESRAKKRGRANAAD